MYEAAWDARINLANFRANRQIVGNGIIIGICVILFTTHWLWLRRLGRNALS